MIIPLKNINNSIVLVAAIILHCPQNKAMDRKQNPMRSSSSQLATSPVRSSSPTQLKIYLPGNQIEPHRYISTKNLTQLRESFNSSTADDDSDDDQVNEGKLLLHLRDSHGLTPLEFAIKARYLEGIIALMQEGATPTLTNEETWQNSFHICAAHGTAEIARYLIVCSQFFDIQESMQQACTLILEKDDSQRGNLVQEWAQNLKELHIMHIRSLITQPDKQDTTPVTLLETNQDFSAETLDPQKLEAQYGKEVAERYLAEIVNRLNQKLLLSTPNEK